MTVGDWLARREMLTPNKVALIDAQRDYGPITYRAWNRAANRTANFLRDRGVRQGDRVAMLAMNCVEYLDVWFACGKLGAILQTLNWRLTPDELAGLIEDATPLVLIYGVEFETKAAALQARPGSLRHFITLDRATLPNVHLFSERDAFTDDPPPTVELDWNDAWTICYTGGTTGVPKALSNNYFSVLSEL